VTSKSPKPSESMSTILFLHLPILISAIDKKVELFRVDWEKIKEDEASFQR